MPVFDSQLMFRTGATFLSTSESNGPLTIRGTGIQGLAGRVVIPSGGGTSKTVYPRYYGSSDGVTYRLIAAHPGGPHSAFTTNSLELITPIITPLKYIIEELLINSTSMNFGDVVSGLVVLVDQDWTRTVNFE